jgi:hypothetical protein
MSFLIDAATFTAAVLVMPALAARLQTSSGTNALLIAVAFLIFCAGVYAFRLMKPSPAGSERWLSRGVAGVLALFFAFVISLAIAWQLGFFASMGLVDTTQLGEGGSASYFVFGPGAWLAFSLLYVLVFAFRVTPRIDYGGVGYFIAALIGLVAANGMLLVLGAQGSAILDTANAGWAWVIPILLLLVALFLPPRLLFMTRVLGLQSPPNFVLLAVFLVVLGVYAAQMLYLI